MNKFFTAALVLLATASVSHAEDAKPIRVIEITREAAEQSAAVLAAAKNPTIGMPPQGQAQGQQALAHVTVKGDQVARVTGRDRANEFRNVREARAEAVVTPAPGQIRSTQTVQVISPTAFGRLAVQVFDVSSRP